VVGATPSGLNKNQLKRILVENEIGGIEEGDGLCMKEDLDPVTLSAAQKFQKWFVENYFDGKYIYLKGDDKIDTINTFFDIYVDPVTGLIGAGGIAQMSADTGLDMSFLQVYLNCLFVDNGLDENELVKAIAVGDPHFTSWQGANFDYHGACDLVMIHNENFNGYAGMDLHVRTEQIESGEYSFISDVALRLGSDILEVRKNGSVFLNHKSMDASQFPLVVGGFPATIEKDDKCFDIGQIHTCVASQTVEVVVGEHEKITFKVFKDMVHVEVIGRPREMAMGAVGLMGTYPAKGHGRVARDGFTAMQAAGDFGLEWQVRDSDAKLFMEDRYPQFPDACIAPAEVHASQRNLQDNAELSERAHAACAHVSNDRKTYKNCMFDVMSTGDETHAMIYGAW